MATKKKKSPVKKKKVVKPKPKKKVIVKKKAKKKAKKKMTNTATTLPSVESGNYVYSNGSGKPDNGRPPVAIDVDKVYELSRIGCTQKEIYCVLKVSKATFVQAKKNNSIIQETIDAGRENGNASLRKKQLQVAMQGNPQMLIWLGKNKLKQSDRSIQHMEISQGETFKNALKELDNEDDDVIDLDDLDG